MAPSKPVKKGHYAGRYREKSLWWGAYNISGWGVNEAVLLLYCLWVCVCHDFSFANSDPQ